MYHPSDADCTSMRDYVQSSLEYIESSIPNPAIIIAGDFNKLDLQATVKPFQLKPVIDFPTRGANTLDQIYTNLSEYYSPPTSAPPFGLSDHLTIAMCPGTRKRSHEPQSRIVKIRDKRPSNIRSLGRFLQEIPWDILSSIPSNDQKLYFLTSIINYGLNLIMPERSIKVHPNDRPWVTSNLKSLINRRQKAFASGNVTLFKMLRNKVNRERKRCRKSYYQSKVHNLRNTNPRDWWREVKQLCGTSKHNNKSVKDRLHQDLWQETDINLSNKINNVFINVIQNYVPLSEDTAVIVHNDETPIIVTESTIARKLQEISTSRSSGPDGISNWVLKTYSDILASPVANIINSSFQSCKVPQIWKLADVVPLPKTSTVKDLERELRPISLTSTLSKIAERLVIEREVKPTLLKVVDPQQFGFIPNSSTVLALISMLHCWLSATDGSGSSVRTVFLDYKKAFDTVDHTTLVAKLFSLGIKPCVVNWIIDFLRNRWQRVKLSDNCFSDWLQVPAGVPQGTRLGPWLFLAMINDLVLQNHPSEMWKFADDTTVSEIGEKNELSTLQMDIDDIATWSMNNSFQLNPFKCKEMVISFSRLPPVFEPIRIGDRNLERVTSIKSLGVILRNDLKWTDHVNSIVSKTAKRLYLLRRLKRADVASADLVKFFCSCIRSVLEYACQLFHSSLSRGLAKNIERIQKRAMKIIFYELSYDEALNIAGISTLENRREYLSNNLFNDIVLNDDHKLAKLLPSKAGNRELRKERSFEVLPASTNRFGNSFINFYAKKHYKSDVP